MRQVPVKNFLPQNCPDSGGVSELKEQPEYSSWNYGRLYSSGVLEDVSVTTHGLQFSISRETLVNDAVAEIAAMFQALGNAAALHAAESIAAALEDTSNLSDGAPYFGTATSNLMESRSGGGAPSTATLDLGAARLWRMPVGEHIAGSAPHFVVVPPELQMSTKALVASTYDPAGTSGTLRAGRIDTVVLPHLTSAKNWYLLGDPVAAPALAMLHLAGGTGEVTMLERITVPHRDGITLRLRTDYNIARVSRNGAIKVESP